MNIIERLSAVMPKHVKPIANNPRDHLAAMEKISQAQIKLDEEKNKQDRVKAIMGRSGVSLLHQDCSFDNYVVSNKNQRDALVQAKNYAENFGNGFGGFIFSGSRGTGKNHLAAAICNDLIQRHFSVLCVTLPNLMMKFRETYSKEYRGPSEQSLFNEFCKIDLLIIDEIGIQHLKSENTHILINQIVDERTSNKKPIGMLTNLDHAQLCNEDILGGRVMDRMTMDGGLWVNFNWESYRSNVKTQQN